MAFTDEYFMKQAYKQALIAFDKEEIPIGAIVVANNKIIAKSYNEVENLNDATAHAEMISLTSAQNYIGSKYLVDCTLYVTLEPCVMCAGALSWTQMSRVVFGASDPQKGFRSYSTKILHPKAALTHGIMEKECLGLLQDFFKRMRN